MGGVEMRKEVIHPPLIGNCVCEWQSLFLLYIENVRWVSLSMRLTLQQKPFSLLTLPLPPFLPHTPSPPHSPSSA